MSSTETDRAIIRSAYEHFEEWKFAARDQAYTELFEGPNAVLTDEELQLLDRIDSDLTRQGSGGLWGADEYGIVLGVFGAEEPRVVCTYHPEIPYEGYRGTDSLSEATREELNDVLWDYCERVAEIIQDELDAFVRSASQEGN